MTDSSLETNSGDGAFDAGSSIDELFGEFADESLEGETDDESNGETTSETGDDIDAGGDVVEDQTAADVFSQLRADAENDADEVLADESPEDIIASADDPDPEPEIDDDLRVDDDQLADLLLTGRTKGKEFLWVESGAADEGETDESEEGVDADSDLESGDASGDDAAASSTVEFETPLDADDASVDTDSDTADDTELDTDSETDSGTGDSETTADAAVEADGHPESEGEVEHESPEDDTPEPEGDDTTKVDSDASESDETALVTRDEGNVPATTDDDGSSGLLGWLRSKLGGLF